MDDIRRNGVRGNTRLPPRTAEVTPDMNAKIKEAVL
jgi:hypothetical protein